eukprot:196234-Pleurochrysis_carterae.AAC.1
MSTSISISISTGTGCDSRVVLRSLAIDSFITNASTSTRNRATTIPSTAAPSAAFPDRALASNRHGLMSM